MLEHIDMTNVLFLDIETVSGKATYTDMDETLQTLWKHKSRSILRQYEEEVTDEQGAETYTEKAGIFAEFGKIVCISVGIVVRNPQTKELSVRLKSFANRDEAVLLTEFNDMVEKHYNNPHKHFFCGHNLREFDIPYICRRILINQLPLPKILDIAGKKPWEVKYLLDTLEMWKFGDYKHYTSLKLLAAVFGFPSPKDDIDGSNVGRVFWEEDDLERIAVYCEKDVLAVVQLMLKYKRQPILEGEQIIHVGAPTT